MLSSCDGDDWAVSLPSFSSSEWWLADLAELELDELLLLLPLWLLLLLFLSSSTKSPSPFPSLPDLLPDLLPGLGLLLLS